MDYSLPNVHSSDTQTIKHCYLDHIKIFSSCSCCFGALWHVSMSLPSSLYIASRVENESKLSEICCVSQMPNVCRHKIYRMKECLDSCNQTVKACSFIAYPTHPYRSMRQSCGTLLLKTVELANGRIYFYPFLTYCNVGLDQSL